MRPGDGHRMVAILAVTNTISWGILYYAFAVVLPPIAADLDHSETAVSGALTLALLISAIAGVAAGRYLDRHPARPLMTIGAVGGVLLMLAWSQLDSLLALYATFAGIGLVMAAVLYEPSFVAIAKTVTDPDARRRGITAVTILGALASFFFVPLTQALLDAHGWRTALLVLTVVLAVTVPLHAVLPRGTPAAEPSHRATTATTTLRRGDFQRLTAAYGLVAFAGIAPLVVLIPYLVDAGYGTAFAAFAVGTIGASQVLGRLLFSGLGARLSERGGLVVTFLLVAAGLGLLTVTGSPVTVLAATVLLGTGNGMTTLSRAIVLAERFGTADYGVVASAAAVATTTARAIAPVAATAIAAAAGATTLLAGLAITAASATLLTR